MLIFRGSPTTVFKRLSDVLGINKICYEQDCEPIWNKRDKEVEAMCRELNIQTVEKVSHTLWDPMDVINTNGGHAPLTYDMMLHTVSVLGLPKRPLNDEVDFSHVKLGEIPEELGIELGLFTRVSLSLEFFDRKLKFNLIDRLRAPKTFRCSERPANQKLS